MSSANGKFIDFLTKIPKLESDRSNWVIYKKRFLYAIAAAFLTAHIDGIGTAPVSIVIPEGTVTPTAAQRDSLDSYEVEMSRWESSEAIIKQTIASTISDSLFLEVSEKETAYEMWKAVKEQREKRTRMVTVDMRRKLQAEKCPESGDVRAHLYKLRAIREDLASMGDPVADRDFTSIILGSIPRSYDPYVAAVTTSYGAMDKVLTPTILIDSIRDEADRRAITSPKPKKNEQDAAYAAGQSSGKGKKDGEESKKSKKVRCYNCKKLGHVVKECWAPGGGAEGKGPKQKEKGDKSKGKKVAAKAEGKDDEADGVWMVMTSGEDEVYQGNGEYNENAENQGEMWTGDEIFTESDIWVENDCQNSDIYSPDIMSSDVDDILTELNSLDGSSEAGNAELVSVSNLNDLPDLTAVEADDIEVEIGGGSLEEDLAIDDGEEPMTYTFAATMLAETGSTCETELYDSGATRHMSPYRHKFISFIPIQKKILTAADGGHFEAVGKGDMRVSMPNGKTTSRILLKDVLYAPKMGVTLISIGKIDIAGYAALFHRSQLRIFSSMKEKKMLAQIPMKNGLYRVEHERDVDVAAVVLPEVVSIEKLHRVMGHIAPEAAKTSVTKGLVEGFKLDDSSKMPGTCDSCEYGKAHRKPIKKEREALRAGKIGEEVHSDVWGPSPIQTIGGREYYSAFTDDYSRYSKLYLQRLKSETFTAYKQYEAYLLRQKGAHIKKLHTDHGGEYLSNEFSNHLADAGTTRNLTVHDTPEHNGVAERLNRTLLEKVRAMLHASGLPKFLWGEAIKHAVYLKNRSATKALDGRTPYEVFHNRKPNLRGLPEFGAKVWVHSPGGGKLDGRSNVKRWVGFDEDSSGHRVYSPETRTVSIERSVKFDSGDVNVYLPQVGSIEGGRKKLANEQGSKSLIQEPDKATDEGVDPLGEGVDPLGEGVNPLGEGVDPLGEGVDPLGDNFENLPDVEGRPKRARRESAAVKRLRSGEGVMSTKPMEMGQLPKGVQPGFIEEVAEDDESAAIAAVAVTEMDEVQPSYEEARLRSDWPEWKKAIDVELQNLKEAGTWDVVERPSGVNIVDSKWVFRLKKDAEGKIVKWKARLVARGFTQVQGVDYFETFAPVARLAFIQLILAVAARNDWEIRMFDFHSAYLNGVLSDGETIYMEQPPNHEVADRSQYVVKLRKSLYGLKQAGKKWYDTLCDSLASVGFRRSMADPAVFYVHDGNDVVILFIHVDDTTVTGSSSRLIEEYEQRVGKIFNITHLGSVSWLLGLAITRDRTKRTLSMSQEAYINSIVRRFNLEDAKPLSTPIDANTRLLKDDCPMSTEGKQDMKNVPYREAIGALNWLAVGSRPDIAFVVGQLAQFLENPGRVHWEAAKRVIRYLKTTKDLKLTYGGGGKQGFEGYSDADGATQDHRRAVSGFAVLVDGGAVSWSSKKQELVTLSTMEAEYVGATHAVKELFWFRQLIGEIFRPLLHPIVLHLDNQSAIMLANSEGQFHTRSKHIDIRYHFIKFHVQEGSIILSYCPTEDMIADILTKSVPLIKHKYFTHDLGLLSV